MNFSWFGMIWGFLHFVAMVVVSMAVKDFNDCNSTAMETFLSFQLFAIFLSWYNAPGWIQHCDDCWPGGYILSLIYQCCFLTSWITITFTQSRACLLSLFHGPNFCWIVFGVFQMGHVLISIKAVSDFVACGWSNQSSEH